MVRVSVPFIRSSSVRNALWAVVMAGLAVGLSACPSPQLAVSDSAHTFAPGESDWTFQVWNEGKAGTTLTFTVSPDETFIQVTPLDGSSTGPDDKVDVKVTVDRNAFAKATAKGSVTIASNAGDQAIGIDLTLMADKYALWSNGAQLRGVNIAQRRVYPDLDGPTFIGPGPVGPPFTQSDFDRLAALGANYVNISHPGLYTEAPPFTLDTGVQANLDALIGMAANAGLFVVISARTGPGRSEFTFTPDLAPDLVNDSVWESKEAQDAWVAMWSYTATRYRNQANVVGYDLMVEPNANARFFDDYDPEHFYAMHGGTLYDWNGLHPRIAAAIRAVDANTPILVGPMSYNAASWLPYLQLTGVARTVYTVHTYEPMVYTHQDPGVFLLSYPGRFDADGDGVKETVNRDWLQAQFAPVDDFKAAHNVPVVFNEMGVHRWCPGADRYLGDVMDLIEQDGDSFAVWLFDSSWTEYVSIVDDFDFLHGPNPNNHTNVSNALASVIEAHFAHNAVFP